MYKQTGLRSERAAIVVVRSTYPSQNFPRHGRMALPGLLCLPILLANALCSQASQRLVAWGDIAYDLTADNYSRISCGFYHSLALTKDGTVLAWTDNRFNQTNIPDALTYKPATAIAAGNVHNIALTSSGQVLAWGPAPGQPGDYGQCNVPQNLGEVIAVAAGAVHNLALKPDGTVAAWGANLNGQCNVPAGLNSVIAIAGGMYHSVALRKDGTVVAWGDNAHGQTGVPPGLADVVAIAAGGYHSLALKRDGTVVSWGSYGLAQCSVPAGLSNVIAIATGDLHSLALKADGSLTVWGFNSSGQLTPPEGLTNVVAIAARGRHSMALMTQAAPAPALSIEPTNGTVVVSWPATSDPVLLQQNATLDPANWTTISATPKLVGTRSAVALPTVDSFFFRLVRQP